MFDAANRVYLDTAAAAPVVPAAARAFQKALPFFGNPSASHEEGRKAKEILEGARTSIARHTGVKSDAVIFTGNATEANALAIHGVVFANGTPLQGTHVLYGAGAHASTANGMHALEAYGVEVEEIPWKEGRIDLQALKIYS